MSILNSLVTELQRTFGGQTGVLTPFAGPSHLEHVTVQDLWPDTDLASLMPTKDTALQVGAVAASRNRIVAPIAGMPLVSDSREQWVSDLLAQPEPHRARVVTIAETIDSLIFYGVAYWLVVERTPSGWPSAVVFLDAGRVELRDSVWYVDGERVRNFSDVIRFDAIHSGMLTQGRVSISRAALIEAAAARASDNPVPSIELHQTTGEPLTKAQIDDLVARWKMARNGANGGIAYTGSSIEVKTHGIAAENLLIAGRTATALDIARHFGLPAWAIDVPVQGSSLTYSNVPSRSRELLDYSLRPYMDAIEGRLSMRDITPSGVRPRFDYGRLLRGDFGDRMNAGKVAIDAGIYTPDEIRQQEKGETV